MDTTFPSAATNSSSCSRSSGVMCAFTWAVRFGRVMNKKPRYVGAKPQATRGGGGKASLWVRGSCGPRCKPLTGTFDALVNVWVDASQFVFPALGDILAPLANRRAGYAELVADNLHRTEDGY